MHKYRNINISIKIKRKIKNHDLHCLRKPRKYGFGFC